MRRIAYILGMFFLLTPALADAQVLPFVAVETDAAALGKAGADIVDTESVAYSSFSNVAAATFSDNTLDVAVDYTMWQPSSVNETMLNVGGAYRITDKFAAALGFMYGMMPSYTIVNSNGTGSKQFKPSQMHVNVGLAYKFMPYLSIGVNVGYASESLAEKNSYGALTSDIFVMSKFSDFKVALGVSNLGTKVKSASGASFALPTSVTLGAGYDKVFAQKHGVGVNLDADYYLAGAFAAAVGAGYTYDDMVSVKAGYRYGADSVLPSFASVGVGAKYFGVKLDLAYLIATGDSPLKNTLAISLGYTF